MVGAKVYRVGVVVGRRSGGVVRSGFLLCCTTLLLALSACSGHKAVPLGTIPVAERPSPQDIATTRAAVAQNEAAKGRALRQQGKYYSRTKQVLDRLSAAAGVSPNTWPLYIVDAGAEANAAAVNQNTIVVYEGLIAKVKNDAELATVLAHEISHIVAKHGNDSGRESKITATKVGGTILGVAAMVGAAAVGMNSTASQNVGGIAAAATGAIGVGLILQYDRDQEYEADQIGLMLMAKAGYDPRTAVDFWNRADEVFGSGAAVSFLSTHPATDNRAEKLEEALPVALKYYEQASTRRPKATANNRK